MRSAVLFLFITLLISCSPRKSIQKVQEQKAEISSPTTIATNVEIKTETVKIPDNVFNKVMENRISFTTFNAKIRARYEGKEGVDEATMFVRIKKDSAIWLSLRGPLGIEGYRIMITADSVHIIDLLKKSVLHKNIGYLKEISSVPFDFNTLQDFVVGNPILIDTIIESQKVNENNTTIVVTGKGYTQFITLDNLDYRVLQSKLEKGIESKTAALDITFSDFENSLTNQFSKTRKMVVSGKSKMDILLEFKQFSFNQPVTFPFIIPKNYKRLEE